MTDGMLQLQMLVPTLKTDATLTATMCKTDGLTLEIKSDVKLPESSSVQAVTFKYGKSGGFSDIAHFKHVHQMHVQIVHYLYIR